MNDTTRKILSNVIIKFYAGDVKLFSKEFAEELFFDTIFQANIDKIVKKKEEVKRNVLVVMPKNKLKKFIEFTSQNKNSIINIYFSDSKILKHNSLALDIINENNEEEVVEILSVGETFFDLLLFKLKKNEIKKFVVLNNKINLFNLRRISGFFVNENNKNYLRFSENLRLSLRNTEDDLIISLVGENTKDRIFSLKDKIDNVFNISTQDFTKSYLERKIVNNIIFDY